LYEITLDRYQGILSLAFSLNQVLYVFATANMSLKNAYGERLIASVIDYYANKEPGRVWASVPRSEDLSKGFKDITYKQFANAINHASWWLEYSLGKSKGNFEIFAYAGPKDLRFPILAVAAVKVGRQVSQIDWTSSVQFRCTDCQSLTDLVTFAFRNGRSPITCPGCHQMPGISASGINENGD